MKFFEKKAVAIVLSAVVIAGSFLLSAYEGLRAEIRNTEALYFSGVEAERGGYVRPSIESQMRVKYTSVNNLLSVLRGYPEAEDAAEALGEANDSIYLYLDEADDDTVGMMAWCNRELEAALSEAEAQLAALPLNEREESIVETSLSDIAGAQSMIEQSGYNEAVRAFNAGTMQKFPAHLLSGLSWETRHGADYFN